MNIRKMWTGPRLIVLLTVIIVLSPILAAAMVSQLHIRPIAAFCVAGATIAVSTVIVRRMFMRREKQDRVAKWPKRQHFNGRSMERANALDNYTSLPNSDREA